MSMCGFYREEINMAARKEGRLAQAAGASLSDNPYRSDAPKRNADKSWHWVQGYLASEFEQWKKEKEHGSR